MTALVPLLSADAVLVMRQLFLDGPTLEARIAKPSGRDELIGQELAFRDEGWAALTVHGLRTAIAANCDWIKEARDRMRADRAAGRGPSGEDA